VTQQQALDGGDVDLAFGVPLENIDAYRANPDFTVVEEPSFFNYGPVQHQRAPLDPCRQALSHAIPYADITVGAQGFGTNRTVPCRPASSRMTRRSPVHDRHREGEGASPRPATRRRLPDETYAAENQNEASLAPLLADAFGQLASM
jgi:ABC-type transport system substrate-binding protein